jgi:F-type H+-transporting ATPase subunit beta
MGRVVQVIGPVIDVEFETGGIPEIYNALEIRRKGENGGADIRVVAEVQQHIGRGQVRAVSMSSTDGVTRGMDVENTGSAITVPVGEAALGPRAMMTPRSGNSSSWLCASMLITSFR